MEVNQRKRPRDEHGRFRTGAGGRVPGVANKITRELREVIRGALDELGGQAYLVEVGREKPEVFCRLLQAVIPIEVKAALTMPAGGIIVVSGIDAIPGEFVRRDRLEPEPLPALPSGAFVRTGCEGESGAYEGV